MTLVSCILPTIDRKQFLKQAIKYFIHQTYENKELIIIDDGLESKKDIIPTDSKIKYIRLNNRTNLGRKLNIGIWNSQGQIIQKLDDDDYYHPDFLKTTVTALDGQNPQNSIVGFGCFLVLISATGELKFSGNGWFSGGTFCFYKKLWEEKSFQNVPRAVDYWFLKDHSPIRIKIKKPELYIVVRHNFGHIWTNLKNIDVTDYFSRRPIYSKSLKECISSVEDQAFYENLKQQC